MNAIGVQAELAAHAMKDFGFACWSMSLGLYISAGCPFGRNVRGFKIYAKREGLYAGRAEHARTQTVTRRSRPWRSVVVADYALSRRC